MIGRGLDERYTSMTFWVLTVPPKSVTDTAILKAKSFLLMSDGAMEIFELETDLRISFRLSSFKHRHWYVMRAPFDAAASNDSGSQKPREVPPTNAASGAAAELSFSTTTF
jgi:hypothetical protein